MGHKILQDHAYVFCQMFMGWRMGDDLDTFLALPDGTLTIDVLNGSCNHSELGIVQTRIAAEIAAWFSHRLDEHKIPHDDIVDATLTVHVKHILPVSKRKRGVTFDWSCDGMIKTTDREYCAHLAEPHTWIPMP